MFNYRRCLRSQNWGGRNDSDLDYIWIKYCYKFFKTESYGFTESNEQVCVGASRKITENASLIIHHFAL